MSTQDPTINSTDIEQPSTLNELSKYKYIEVGYAFDNGGFSRNHFGTIEMIPDLRQARNNTGLYRTSYFYDSMDPYNATLFGDLYFDFDSEEDVEYAREDLLFVIWKMSLEIGFNLPMDAFRIWFSGKKGFHLIIPWQYLNIQPHNRLDELFRWIAEDLKEESPHGTIDLVVYEKRRLFRLEHSIHQDTGLYKIPLHYHEAKDLNLHEMGELAKENRVFHYPKPHVVPQAEKRYNRYIDDYKNFLEYKKKNPTPTPQYKKGEVPEPVQELIDQGPTKGTRNEAAAALASFWNNQGYEKEEVWGLLLEWNDGSLPERELKNTMNSILSRGLTYGLSRFKSILEGEVGAQTHERNAYKEYKKKGR